MKHILVSLTLIIAGCSTSIDGLWIEGDNQALLKFYKDSVINNTNIIDGRLGYRITKDSITFTDLNPEWNNGKTENSFRYQLTRDTLIIWYGKDDHATKYFKVSAETYHDYFLKRDDITIEMPFADNAGPTSVGGQLNLDIKIGFRDKEIIFYIQDSETDISKVGQEIGKFKIIRDSSDFFSRASCRLFIDKNVPCEYTLGLFDYLRFNDIRTLYFITETRHMDEYDDNFYGLKVVIPREVVNIVEEKNER